MNIVDEKVKDYISGHYKPVSPFLDDLRKQAEKADIPIMQRETESLLLTLLEIKKPKHILEIGTAIGYSALCFATVREGVHITTLELQERHKITAKAHFYAAGVENQIRVLLGDARDSLGLLGKEVKAGAAEPFDFIFIDGAKSHYKEIWDLCMPLCKADTVIVSDNVLYKGIVAADDYLDHRRNKTVVRRMRAYLEHITSIPEVTTSILPVGDGVAISVIGGVKTVKKEYFIEPCSGRAITVKEGQKITVVDIDGAQVVDFFAESKNNESEFLSTGVTIDCNESLKLKVGDTIYSNLYNPMFTLLIDDVGEHDLLHPCCSPEMYEFFYQNGEGHHNCLENINGCLNKQYPIIQPVNLFMNTKINTDGSISVERPVSEPGDKVVLKAKMDVRLGIAACSVSESKCNGGK
ncbi:MAG TPA: DUF1989 domain-containing protein, partial [Anaerovoracaceae bacterium]|nr:DUF1989 domain-containing protein [Anaerovoracaceae bacterium]